MADIFATISKDTTVSEITRVARVGRNPQTGKEIQMAARKRPGRTKYSNIVLKRIAEKLKDINPLFAVRFEREQQDEVAISSYNKLLTPAKKVVKFKAGSELADSVKSVGPGEGLDSETEIIEYDDGNDLKSSTTEGGRTIGAGQVIAIVESKGTGSDLQGVSSLENIQLVQDAADAVEQAAEDAADAVEE